MTNVLLQLWACNAWEEENDLLAASDQAECGPNWNQTAEEMIRDVERALDSNASDSSDQGTVFTADEWFASLTRDWPTINPVIPADLFVERGDSGMQQHWQEHWAREGESADINIQCFDYAHYQLVVAGFGTSSWRPDTTTYQIFREDSGIDLNETAEGVRYLKRSLAADTPVLVGILLTTYDARPNRDKTTNHFVVIVGMGVDEFGHHFRYYDYSSNDRGRKFYLKDSSLAVEDRDGHRRVAQIRQTYRM